MRKLILTAVALMCSGLWAVAQSSTPDTSASPSGQAAGAPSSSSSTGAQSAGSPSSSASANGSTTIDGCLAGSAGSYTLKDKATGTTYNLSGPTSALASHVGHELQVTGTTSGSSSASSSGSASSAAGAGSTSSTPSSSASGSSGNQTLNVTSAKMVSSNCSAQ